MADSIYLSASEQMASNYEKYSSMFTDSTAELVNSETFLSLLVAEMTNQDPLEPTSNTEFVTQMATFTQLQYMQDTSTYAMSTYASSLVGKTATASKMDGADYITKTGVVTSVTKSGDTFNVIIDGVSFDLSKVTAVSDTASTTAPVISTGNELGDQISRASLMIGMSATVSASTSSGTALDSGIIEAIQIKDGEISAVINGIAYKLSDIIEVAYPTYNYGDETSTDESVSDVEEVTGEIIPDVDDAEDLEDLLEDTDEPAENIADIAEPSDEPDIADELADLIEIIEEAEI